MKYIKLLIIGIIIGFLGGVFYIQHEQATYVKNSSPVATTTSKDVENEEPVTITFVGDIMFDRYIRAQAEEYGYEQIFTDVNEQLQNVDLVVGNLEGPITNLPSVSTYDPADPNHYRFTFSPEVAPLLVDHNIRLVSIGNNHIENFGADGLSQTTDFLHKADIQFIGHPIDTARMSTTTEINNQLFGFTSYNYADEHDKEATIDEIIRLKAADSAPDWIIVYAHWGQEYQPQPSTNQKELARQFVDAGADLVIGSHPHVIQSKEVYKDTPIYYSLGNFVFDQYFSPEVRCGLMLTIRFDTDGNLQTEETFTELIEDGSTIQSTCRDSIPTVQ